jgi:RimJ/RimL family protein N-acetyltransferase
MYGLPNRRKRDYPTASTRTLCHRGAMHPLQPLALPDGARVAVRPLEPRDRSVVEAIFAGLGERSRRARFHGSKPRLTESDLQQLTAVDHRDHEAFVALEEGTGRPVGVVRFVRDVGDPSVADVAFSVVDDWHGRGLGSLLTETVVRRACRLGVTRFRADVVAGNRRALALIEKLGEIARSRYEGGAVELEVELAACSLPAGR